MRKAFAPSTVLLFHPAGVEKNEIEGLAPYLEPMLSLNGRAAAYFCRNRSCLLPVHSPEELSSLLQENAF